MTAYPPSGGNEPPGGYIPPGNYPPPAGYPQAGGFQPPGFSPGIPSGGPLKVRPGRIWYLVDLAVFAAGLAWLITSIFAFAGTIDGFQRVPMPAGGKVHLGHTGGYIVYYEGPGAQNGRFPSFFMRVTPASSGASVASHSLRQYGSSLTYNVGSHHGRAIFTMNITGPGTFAVTISGTPAPGSDLAFGGSIARGIVGLIVPAVPLMVLGFFGWLVLFIIRIARKSSMRRAGVWAGG
jgi:hypothetical protein